MADIKVRVGEREMTLEQAEKTMDVTIADTVRREHPNANTEAGAQAFVDAYAQAHHLAHGQPWTAEA